MGAGRIKGITIEIGGDTTKLTQALSKVDNALGKTKNNLKDLEKALKLDPGNAELLKDRQQELSHAINETKQRLEAEKEAYQQLANSDRTPESEEKMRQLKVQIDLDTAALKDLENQARESASVLGSQMQAAGEKVKEVGEKIKDVGEKVSKLGSDLTNKVTLPIVAAFGTAIKTTMDFDSQMSKVQAISGATADEFQDLRAFAREMGESTKYSATEAAEGFEYMAMAGWKTDQMLSGLPGILNLAAASGEELGTTSDIVTDALTAFGYSANDAAHFADILAAASSNANTNVSMMGESFKYAAPVAGALGYSAEDVAVALGLMANAGIKASQAGTSLRNIFQRMAKPTKESAEAMDRLGLSLYDDSGKMYSFREIMDQIRNSMSNINAPVDEYVDSLEALDAQLESGELTQKKYDAAVEELNLQTFGAEGAEKARAAAMLGGARAMAGLLAISNATEEDYEKLTKAVDNSSEAFARLADGSIVPLNEALESGQEIMETYEGTAAAMAGVMQNNLGGDVTTLKSKLQELAISFGDLLTPALREASDAIKAIVDKLNSLDDEQKKNIIKVLAIVAAIGPVLIFIGNLIQAIGLITTAIGAVSGAIGTIMPVIAAIGAPIFAIIGAIMALVAAFVYFYNTNDQFREKVNGVIDAVKERFAAFCETIKSWISQIIEWLQPIADAMGQLFTAIGENISAVIDIIVAVIEVFKAIVSNWIQEHQMEIQMFFDTVKFIVETAIFYYQTVITTVLEVIKTYISTFISVITEIVQGFTALLKGDWDAAAQHFQNATQKLKNGVIQIFKIMWESIKTLFNEIVSRFKTWGNDMIENLISGIKEKFERLKGTISSIAELISSYIHFSEPDIGPLSNFHTFAPDMMKSFADGIRQNAYLISDAMSSSFDLRPYFNSMTSGLNKLTSATTAGFEAQSEPQPIVLQVSLEGDAERMFRVLSEEAHRDWQITGQSRLMGY